MSDLSQVFIAADIFTFRLAISGLKSSLWADLGQPVRTSLDSSIFAGRYHNLQYWFSDSIYIAGINTSGLMYEGRILYDIRSHVQTFFQPPSTFFRCLSVAFQEQKEPST